jgi:hypothetical protein
MKKIILLFGTCNFIFTCLFSQDVKVESGKIMQVVTPATTEKKIQLTKEQFLQAKKSLEIQRESKAQMIAQLQLELIAIDEKIQEFEDVNTQMGFK